MGYRAAGEDDAAGASARGAVRERAYPADSRDVRACSGLILQCGQPPNRIDLMSAITGVTFEEAWATRVEAAMVDADVRTPIPYIGVNALVTNKRETGRPRDLDDLGYLDPDS